VGQRKLVNEAARPHSRNWTELEINARGNSSTANNAIATGRFATRRCRSRRVAADDGAIDINNLQRALGNRAMTRLLRSEAIQAKLTVGPPATSTSAKRTARRKRSFGDAGSPRYRCRALRRLASPATCRFASVSRPRSIAESWTCREQGGVGGRRGLR
jgi:hypothetical protein